MQESLRARMTPDLVSPRSIMPSPHNGMSGSFLSSDHKKDDARCLILPNDPDPSNPFFFNEFIPAVHFKKVKLIIKHYVTFVNNK
jgi:hypothetical protein